MRISVLKETAPGERRVALVPESVKRLTTAGHTVTVERDAGTAAHFSDAQYETAGATIAPSAAAAASGAAIVAKVQRPSLDEVALLDEGSAVVSLLQPAQHADVVQALAARRVTAFALELVPRITRAQSMDVLSSQATIAGYKAVLVGATALARLLPMLTTAAGSITPAKTFVIGAGVAGLQAIATAKRLGAVVSAFDIRPAAREQVQSLGASFVAARAGRADRRDRGRLREGAVERRAGAHGRRTRQAHQGHGPRRHHGGRSRHAPRPSWSPTPWSRRCAPAPSSSTSRRRAGGNCALTRAGETVVAHDVTIIGAAESPQLPCRSTRARC